MVLEKHDLYEPGRTAVYLINGGPRTMTPRYTTPCYVCMYRVNLHMLSSAISDTL